eukprot:gene10246-gene11034
MYKINLLFKSNIPGVYTKEEEIATDKFHMELKQRRMIERWFDILCPHIGGCVKTYWNIQRTDRIVDYNERTKKENEMMIHLIDQTLDDMDMYDEEMTGIETTLENMRKFKITVEEI